MKERSAPKIGLAPIPKGYGELLVHGFDWWQECLNLKFPGQLWQKLKDAKARAVELDDRRKTPIAFDLGEKTFQLQPTGAKGGVEFVLVNDDYRINIGSPNREWSFSWRATSAAIWGKGIHQVRDQLYAILEWENINPIDPKDFIKLTRVDYCFDIHSRRFTQEMFPRIAKQTVCPSETKVRGDWVVQEDRLETLTIGLGSVCQVQIYDKSKEIVQASQKTWLYDIWGMDQDTGEIIERDDWADVWRVEVRLRKEWLKARKVNTPEKFLEHQWACISDALYNRRLCQPTKDSNRRRWPLHTLYSIVLKAIDNPVEFRPIDRRVTGRADELDKTITRGLAGTLRSLVVLRHREDRIFDEETANQALEEVLQLLLSDRDHQEKIRRAVERYELVDAPV